MNRFLTASMMFIMLAFGLSGCAATYEKLEGETVDYTYRPFKLSLRNDGAFIQFRYTAKEIGGKVAVCGAFAESKDGRIRDVTPLIVARGFILMGDERIITGLDFFREYTPGSPLADKVAGCVITREDWAPGYAPGKTQIDFPRSGYKTT